jgi:hypothetical protein
LGVADTVSSFSEESGAMLVNRLGQWFSSKAKSSEPGRRAAARPKPYCPQVECLEARDVPSAGKVLILDSTVTMPAFNSNANSFEAQEAIAKGFQVDVVNASQWAALTRAQFASYQAIVLGDPTCGSLPDIAAAEANKDVWGPVVQKGNDIIIGTDPVFHSTFGNNAAGAQKLVRSMMDFVLTPTGHTGLYLDLSCYYDSTAPHTPVTICDIFDPAHPGSFTVTGVPCEGAAHKVANHPALASITDADLSGWECSVHEAFDKFPSSFTVLAIATDAPPPHTFRAADGTTGDPYILVKGKGVVVIGGTGHTKVYRSVAYTFTVDPKTGIGTFAGDLYVLNTGNKTMHGPITVVFHLPDGATLLNPTDSSQPDAITKDKNIAPNQYLKVHFVLQIDAGAWMGIGHFYTTFKVSVQTGG